MTHVFGLEYASAYDALYQDKDYALECQALMAALSSNHGSTPARILDLGCGTGQHAIILASEGHHVTGVDRSSSMLALAQQNMDAQSKAKNQPLDIRLVEDDLCQLSLEETFDAVFMLFAVLGYQYRNADVLKALQVARKHLRPGGLLLFDVWYGPAVLADRPGSREKTVTQGDAQLTRKTTSTLDTSKHLCDVHFQLTQSKEGQTLSQFQETHRMRYFFPMELELFLTMAGFEQMQITAFPSVTTPADDTSWNVFCSSKAASSIGQRK